MDIYEKNNVSRREKMLHCIHVNMGKTRSGVNQSCTHCKIKNDNFTEYYILKS